MTTNTTDDRPADDAGPPADDPPGPVDDVPGPIDPLGPEKGPGESADRYPALEVADGEVLIYDRDEHTAWIRSDAAVPVSAIA